MHNLLKGGIDMDINSVSSEVKAYSLPKVQETLANLEKNSVVNKGNEVKKQYLELAVGNKEKELKRLGLTEEEDGVITMKKNDMDMTPWERLQAEELEKVENDKVKEEKLERTEEKKEKIEEEKEEGEENAECETCANRKYLDGSDEMVSFKSAAHISPESAGTRVRAHEQEHVNNAYEKAELKDGKVQFASIAIHTSVCPECGRTYVSGGTTTTTIKYNNDDYATVAKKQDATVVPGAKVDELS